MKTLTLILLMTITMICYGQSYDFDEITTPIDYSDITVEVDCPDAEATEDNDFDNYGAEFINQYDYWVDYGDYLIRYTVIFKDGEEITYTQVIMKPDDDK